jgi:uncharacterized protein (TIGR02145 family)
MKKLKLLFVFSILAFTLTAQVPQSFKYQAVARNNDGAVVANSPIGLKISILQGNTSGSPVYCETFTAVSNSSGVFSVNIGEGDVVSGDFGTIEWGEGACFLKVEMDISGGNSYVEMGTSQLLSVPYSLYSASIYVYYSNDTLWIGDKYVILSGGGGPPSGTVTDYDGNVYQTVEIGNQIWMKENLRSLHYADGTPVDSVWVYDDNENNAQIWGRLYSWNAAMHGASSSNGNPSGVQGICPDGWHLPSKAEFEELIGAAGGAFSGGSALKSDNNNYWQTPNSNNNQTGFSAYGAGYRTDPLYYYTNLKETTSFWSSTEDNGNVAQKMNLKWNLNSVNVNSLVGTKNTGYSVRCVKD